MSQRYTKIQLLGSGTFGDAFLAICNTDNVFDIKELID